MKPILAAAMVVLLGGCATSATREDARPLFTRAALNRLTTDELARLFLNPSDVPTVMGHEIAENHIYISDISWHLRFKARDRPVGADICERTTFLVDFNPLKGTAAHADTSQTPSRAEPADRYVEFALAPGCAELPGRRFAYARAWSGTRLSEEEMIAILRTLAAAQAAAAGPGPLPFSLTCLNNSRRWEFKCPTDLRPVLAALPLHQAFTIERHPTPNNCDSSSRDEGDAVEIGKPDEYEIWDVRLRNMGTERAEVALIRQFPRTNVKC